MRGRAAAAQPRSRISRAAAAALTPPPAAKCGSGGAAKTLAPPRTTTWAGALRDPTAMFVHLLRSRSVARPFASTRIQPFIGRPVRSKMRACFELSAFSVWAGLRRHYHAVRADAAAHVAVQQEGDAPEHPLFGVRRRPRARRCLLQAGWPTYAAPGDH